MHVTAAEPVAVAGGDGEERAAPQLTVRRNVLSHGKKS